MAKTIDQTDTNILSFNNEHEVHLKECTSKYIVYEREGEISMDKIISL